MLNKRDRRRVWLVIFALIITSASIIFTNNIAREVEQEEHRKMQSWAEATKLLLNDEYSDFVFSIVEQNENIPVIIVDDRLHYISARNFKEPKKNVDKFYRRQIARLRGKNEPIEIRLDEHQRQYIYYDDSLVLKQLAIFPYIQLTMIAFFFLILIWAVSTDKRSEQNKVWVGLTKETAHQLGTPLTSLMGWIEILRMRLGNDNDAIIEMEKDISRLKTITERFSKVGSIPELRPTDALLTTEHAINYMRTRTSQKIIYSLETSAARTICPLSPPLFEWVIENICKNAIDAMNGEGNIDFELSNEGSILVLDITDSGKGIERTKYKSIFQPGYTTKKRGWGLGLSLSKRIIEEYHCGKIFVKSSEINLGTTFRLEIPLIQQQSKACEATASSR